MFRKWYPDGMHGNYEISKQYKQLAKLDPDEFLSCHNMNATTLLNLWENNILRGRFIFHTYNLSQHDTKKSRLQTSYQQLSIFQKA